MAPKVRIFLLPQTKMLCLIKHTDMTKLFKLIFENSTTKDTNIVFPESEIFEEILEVISSYLSSIDFTTTSTENKEYKTSGKFNTSLKFGGQDVFGDFSLERKEDGKFELFLSASNKDAHSDPKIIIFQPDVNGQLTTDPEIKKAAQEILSFFVSKEDSKKLFWRDFFRAIFATKKTAEFKFDKANKIVSFLRKEDNAQIVLDLKLQEYKIFDEAEPITGSINTTGNPKQEAERLLDTFEGIMF